MFLHLPLGQDLRLTKLRALQNVTQTIGPHPPLELGTDLEVEQDLYQDIDPDYNLPRLQPKLDDSLEGFASLPHLSLRELPERSGGRDFVSFVADSESHRLSSF
ncbi:hypothetical protein V6N13_053718 [Hibiscus sabdariffa]|uniref:Uncharacterized protein n=1 Tax=Hibiscus sabdariffa TaxID=183260 RepID=A0ABR2T7D3_9ROSI